MLAYALKLMLHVGGYGAEGPVGEYFKLGCTYGVLVPIPLGWRERCHGS